MHISSLNISENILHILTIAIQSINIQCSIESIERIKVLQIPQRNNVECVGKMTLVSRREFN